MFTEVPVELPSFELQETKPQVVEDVPKPIPESKHEEQKQEKKPKKSSKKDITPQMEDVPKETQYPIKQPDEEKPTAVEETTAEEIKEILENESTPPEEKPKKVQPKPKKVKEKEVVIPEREDDIPKEPEDLIEEKIKDSEEQIEEEKQQKKSKKSKKKEDTAPQVREYVEENQEPAKEPKETEKKITEKAPKDKDDVLTEETQQDKIPEPVLSKKPKLVPMKIERVTVKVNEAQHSEEVEGPQFTKLKLKKSSQKPKQEQSNVTLPKFQLKSRIRYVNDWPPEEIKPTISFLGSVRQNGELSRNMKEAAKIKKKPIKVPIIPDMEKIQLEKPEEFDFSPQKAEVSDYPEEKSFEETVPITEDSQPLKTKEKVQKETTPEKISEKPKKQSNKPIEQQASDDIPTPKPTPKPEEEPEQQHTQVREEPSEPIVEEEKIITDEKPVDEKTEVQQQPKKTKKKLKPIKAKLDSPENINEDVDTQQQVRPNDVVEIEEPHEKISGTIKEVDEVPSKIDEIETPDEIVVDATITEPTIEEKPKKVKKVKKKDVCQGKLNEKPTPEVLEDTVPEPEEIPFKPEEVKEVAEEKPKKKKKTIKLESAPTTEDLIEPEIEQQDSVPKQEETKKLKPKLVPIKIERKVLEFGQVQHAENVEGPQFTQLKLKKTAAKPKSEAKSVTLPAFQLKSRIRYVNDWPPQRIKSILSFLGSVRQNGILSRNIKEAAKIKKKVYKEPELPDIEKTELEKPTFGYEDIIQAKKQVSDDQVSDDDVKDEEPEQVTLKPRRPSVKKTEEVEEEVTIKKALKPRRKPSITLPEITEPETVTFRPKSTKTKEDVEQEFNIHLDSYAEEEISLTSKVKLKPQRQPTFTEEADEASIKFYEEEEGPDIVEIIESDVEFEDDTANVMMSLKKPKKVKKQKKEEITSSVTISKPKPIDDETSEITEDVSLKLERKPKYEVNDQEEVSFDVKAQTDQFTMEELSLSSKVKLKSKKKPTISEAADEASIKLTQEIEDDSQVEEVILSEAESEENIAMFIKRKPKKPAYEVSEVEELSVEFKPKKINEDTYEEEQLTISAKRKPRKPSQIQGKRNDVSAAVALGTAYKLRS